MSEPAPFLSRPMAVEDGWVDYNGHMNAAFYGLLFERGGDDAFNALDLGANYAQRTGFTIFTAETHIRYVRELHRGETVTVAFQLLEFDTKRMRTFQEVRHADGWIAATAETLSLHIDMSGPRVAPFGAEAAARLEAMHKAHASLPRPERIGEGIALKRRA